MSTMDVGSNLQWSTASTITTWNHFHSTVTKNYQNLSQLWQRNDIRVPLKSTYLIEREETLYICPMWMWEAIKGELQAQP
jgi:hypothetical protein